MELVTGKAGTNHISGADLAAMYRGLLIADDVVLATGDKLSCTMTDANTAEIGTGDCMIQAHHCRVEVAEQVTIESGASGYNRNDLIVARYTLGDGGIQSVYLAVVKGTAVAGEASDPSYAEGSIDGGDVLVEFPLWRIPLSGVSVGDPERIMPTVDTLQAQISTLRESVTLETGTVTAEQGIIIFSYRLSKVGKRGHLFIRLKTNNLTLPFNAKIATIPVGFRPAQTEIAAGAAIASNVSSIYPAEGAVLEDGSVYFGITASGSVEGYLNITYDIA